MPFAEWIRERGEADGVDPTRVAVAGDSAGGNMATVLTIMAKQRGDPQFVHQSLYYPMTDANPPKNQRASACSKMVPMEVPRGSSGSEQLPCRRGSAKRDHRLPAAGEIWPILRTCHPLWSSSIRTTCPGPR